MDEQAWLEEIVTMIEDFRLEGVRKKWGFNDKDNPDLLTANERDKTGAFIYLSTLINEIPKLTLAVKRMGAVVEAARRTAIEFHWIEGQRLNTSPKNLLVDALAALDKESGQ